MTPVRLAVEFSERDVSVAGERHQLAALAGRADDEASSRNDHGRKPGCLASLSVPGLSRVGPLAHSSGGIDNDSEQWRDLCRLDNGTAPYEPRERGHDEEEDRRSYGGRCAGGGGFCRNSRSTELALNTPAAIGEESHRYLASTLSSCHGWHVAPLSLAWLNQAMTRPG
jgi:hypothetical protein